MTGQRDLLGIFVHHKVAGNLLMCLMIISGLYAVGQLNRQFFPTFALNTVQVRVVWQGASAEDVERTITVPLEQVLRGVDNLRKMDSISSHGLALLTLEFKDGSERAAVLNEVNQKVEEFRNLPDDAEEPQIIEQIIYEPVATLLLSGSDNLDDLRRLAHHYKQSLLSRGINNVEIVGLPEEVINIEVSIELLESLELTLDQLGDRIDELSQDFTSGRFGGTELAKELRSINQQRDVAGFGELAILSSDNQRLLVDDIATVKRQRRQDGVTLTQHGHPVVELKIRRTKSGDLLKSASILNQWLEETRSTLPPNITLELTNRAWKLVEDRITLMVENGLSGLLLVIAVLYLFLSTRLAWWVALGIPVSFMATLYFLYLFGGTINMISLLGMIIALGIIVDDAIVVAEDAMTHYQDGESAEVAAEGGARRMFFPVIASSLTTIAAFLPLIIISGPVGAILFDVPQVVIVVIIASVIESFFILPSHLRHTFDKIGKTSETSLRGRFERAFNHFRDHTFQRMIKLALHRRGVSLLLVAGAFMITIAFLASGRLPFVFFLTPEPQTLYVNARFTPGTPKTTVDKFLAQLEKRLIETDKKLADQQLVTSYQLMHSANLGNDGLIQSQGDHLGAMVLELLPPDRRDVRNSQLIKAWKKSLNVPVGLDQLTVMEPSAGPPGRDISIRLIGDDAIRLKHAAETLGQTLRATRGVSDVEDDLPYGREQLVWQLTPNGEALGLTTDELGRQLNAAFDGRLVQIFHNGPDELEVRVRLASEERDQLTTLERLNISLPNGDRVPLVSVAEWHNQRGFDRLRHADGQLAVEVSGEVDEELNNANNILGHLESDYLPQLMKQYQIHYSLEGQTAEQQETGADMFAGLVIGMVLIYLILSWIFSSYLLPLVVMAIIPFGLVGAITGHVVMGIDMTVLSLLGFFGLSGIVVNDSINLVSFYQQLRDSSVPTDEALVKVAQLRLRAVVLTSLTTIAGLTPLMFETSLQAQFLIPVAVSIAFGLAFSTILVLLIIPVLLSYSEQFNRWRQQRNSAKAQPGL